MNVEIDRSIPKPLWPLRQRARFRGAKGGRSSGKSHYFAEDVVEWSVTHPHDRILCVREIQRSIKYSAKHLIEAKIESLGVSELFEIMRDEIRRIGGKGVIAFTGLQDQTADSIKSFEDFKIAWFEEAQRMSERSKKVLIPTIRMPGSELWFSWNPEHPDDPVDKLFEQLEEDEDDYVLCQINYTDNPLCPDEAKKEAERCRRNDPDAYDHIWLGGYNKKSDAQVLVGKWRIDEFEPGPDWDGPYYGNDWGYSNDPNALIRFWIAPGREGTRLMIEHEAFGRKVDLMELPDLFDQVPGSRDYVIRADPSRPETIAHMRRMGFRVESATHKAKDRNKGAVAEGITWLRSHEEIVIHSRCTHMIDEAKLWVYKVDRITGDVLPQLVKGNDHGWDAVRYGAAPMIQSNEAVFAWA